MKVPNENEAYGREHNFTSYSGNISDLNEAQNRRLKSKQITATYIASSLAQLNEINTKPVSRTTGINLEL